MLETSTNGKRAAPKKNNTTQALIWRELADTRRMVIPHNRRTDNKFNLLYSKKTPRRVIVNDTKPLNFHIPRNKVPLFAAKAIYLRKPLTNYSWRISVIRHDFEQIVKLRIVWMKIGY